MVLVVVQCYHSKLVLWWCWCWCRCRQPSHLRHLGLLREDEPLSRRRTTTDNTTIIYPVITIAVVSTLLGDAEETRVDVAGHGAAAAQRRVEGQAVPRLRQVPEPLEDVRAAVAHELHVHVVGLLDDAPPRAERHRLGAAPQGPLREVRRRLPATHHQHPPPSQQRRESRRLVVVLLLVAAVMVMVLLLTPTAAAAAAAVYVVLEQPLRERRRVLQPRRRTRNRT